MGSVDERTERLIVRSLDGEASPQEQAELRRVLARDPAAKALWYEYRSSDAMAADAIERLILSPATAGPRSQNRRRAARWLGWGAAAAVVLLLLWPLGHVGGAGDSRGAAGHDGVGGVGPSQLADPAASDPGSSRDGRDYFEPDMKPWLRASREGWVPRVIFHSHPDGEAYFSATDHQSAVFVDDDGAVLARHPGVVHLVVSVAGDRLGAGARARVARLYEFSRHSERFEQIAEFDSEGKRKEP